MRKKQIIFGFLSAVLVTFLLASITGTQVVLAEILGFGLDVSLADRLSATFHDIVGLAPVLIILTGSAFLVAFPVAALCARFLDRSRTYWYLAAGFSSLPVTLILIKWFMGVTLFAAARTLSGMLLFALCGLVGGWLFARVTKPNISPGRIE